MNSVKTLLISVTALAAILAVSGTLGAGEIVYLEGNVQVQQEGLQDWNKAEKGMIVEAGDSIRTARRSRADVALDPEKKNTVRIEEKSLVVLNSASPDNLDRLDLSRGRVYANLENIKAGLSFEVNTPSSVAGVRGSSYMVYVEKDEDEVSAFQDTVFLKSYDANGKLLIETQLPEGFKTFIERFQLPSMFSQITNREFMRFDEAKDDMTDHAEGIERPEIEREQEEQPPLEPMDLQEQIQQQNEVIEEIVETKTDVQDIQTTEQIDDLREQEEYHEEQEEMYLP